MLGEARKGRGRMKNSFWVRMAAIVCLLVIGLTGCQSGKTTGDGEISREAISGEETSKEYGGGETGQTEARGDEEGFPASAEDELASFWKMALGKTLSVKKSGYVTICVTTQEAGKAQVDIFGPLKEYNPWRAKANIVCQDGTFQWEWERKDSDSSEIYHDRIVSGCSLIAEMSGWMGNNTERQEQLGIELDCRKEEVAALVGLAVEYACDLYRETKGGISGEELSVRVYLTEGEIAGESLRGKFWICLNDREPVMVEIKQNADGSEMSADVVEKAEYSEEAEKQYLVTADLQIITWAPPDSWIDRAWESFDKEIRAFDPAGPFNRVDTKYEGFLEGFGGYTEDCPAMDYDGDGLTDRIYQHHTFAGNRIYLFTGKGEVILLNDEYYNTFCRASMRKVDLDADGQPELLYLTKVMGTGGDSEYLALWERSENGWQRRKLPEMLLADGNRNEGNQLLLPIYVEKTDEAHLKITQPDTGITEIIEVPEEEWEHLLYSEERGISSQVDSDQILVITDQETGKDYLRIAGHLGGKWVYRSVVWDLAMEDGEWKIRNFAVEAFQKASEAWRLDREKTKENLIGDQAVLELIEGEKIDTFRIYIDSAGQFNYYFGEDYHTGWCEFPENSDEFAVTGHVADSSVRLGEPETITLRLVTEGDTGYLKMEYRGETLYWKLED